MARARNIKPGFFTNDVLAQCSHGARLVFAGLWTIADREGRLEDRPLRIRAQVMPYDNCDMDFLLNELAQHNFIIRYENASHKYIQITNFRKHQNPHVKEPASTIPAPDKNCYGPADSLLLIPSSTTDSPSPEVLEPDSREAVVADLVSLGGETGAAADAVDSALRVRCTLDHIRQLIAFHGSRPGWGIGALIRRIKNATPRSDPTKGWPEALPSNGRGPSPRKLAEERHYAAQRIIIKGRSDGKLDDEITKELEAKGLSWNEPSG